jgi:hypothetical protein
VKGLLAEDLQYDFLHRWRERIPAGGSPIPQPLSRALRERLPDGFDATLVQPVGGEEEIAFVVVGSKDEVVHVSFEYPSTTTIRYLGSLAGGSYSETVSVDEKGMDAVGTFHHERTGSHLEVRFIPRPPERSMASEEEIRAHERSVQLMNYFRAWAASPAPS